MARFERPPFSLAELDAKANDEARTRLVYDWWCDPDDQAAYLKALGGKLAWIASRAHVEDDPAPPRSKPPRQGHAKVAIISHPADVDSALRDSASFSNRPYADLGGASFMLALDPGADEAGVDWHRKQRQVAGAALRFAGPQLARAADQAARQAGILSLGAPQFDLADYAQQAALRYFGLVFGFAGADHGLLEEAARCGYRALQYLIVGRHFASEPATTALAQQAMARLSARTSALIDDYARLRRSPRTAHQPATTRPDARWPTGVQPWHELGLSDLGEPVLLRLPELSDGLSGQDLCNLVAGLLVGTVGNVQTGICLMVQGLLRDPEACERVRALRGGDLLADVRRRLAAAPPVPFLPRRTLQAVTVQGGTIPAGTDCILALMPSQHEGCPWGEAGGHGIHACLGRELIEPLLVAVLRTTLALPGLEQRLDPLDGEPLAPERLWGFGCSRYPLQYRRDKARVQQPLMVVMPVRQPVAEHAQRLRHVIRSGAPRIQWLLDDSGIVHVAWFEFMDGENLLALRTVYDGDLDAYLEHFALRAGELFDQLFESIEGAPPLPVAEHPHEFIETIRRFNRSLVGGYFYCAYPRTRTAQVVASERNAS